MEAPHDPNAQPGQRGHMSNYQRPFGKPEGLADRLLEHIHRLGTDKQLPWVGLGLIDDLRAASEQLRGPTNSGKPLEIGNRQKPVAYTPPPPSHAPKMEFDL